MLPFRELSNRIPVSSRFLCLGKYSLGDGQGSRSGHQRSNDQVIGGYLEVDIGG